MTWRYHAVFTEPPMSMLQVDCADFEGDARCALAPRYLQAEPQHRGHTIIEQVIAALKNGPLAHLPSGSSTPTPPGWSAP